MGRCSQAIDNTCHWCIIDTDLETSRLRQIMRYIVMCKIFSAVIASLFALILVGCGSNELAEPMVRGERVIRVDGTQGLVNMINAVEFTGFDKRIETEFKVEVGFVRDLTVTGVVPNRPMTSDEVIVAMKARNLRAANIDECLAYTRELLKIQRQQKTKEDFDFDVVCLGQSVRVADEGLFSDKNMIRRKIPVISMTEDKRDLKLFDWDWPWRQSIFLAVKK